MGSGTRTRFKSHHGYEHVNHLRPSFFTVDGADNKSYLIRFLWLWNEPVVEGI